MKSLRICSFSLFSLFTVTDSTVFSTAGSLAAAIFPVADVNARSRGMNRDPAGLYCAVRPSTAPGTSGLGTSKGVGDAAQTSRAAASGALESVLSTFQCSCKTPFNTVTFPDPVIKINIALSLLMFPILNCMYAIQTSQVVLVVKNLPANAG